jgi:hypothetical protein
MVESPEERDSVYLYASDSPTSRCGYLPTSLHSLVILSNSTVRFDLDYQAEPVLLLLSTRRLRHIH